MWSALIYHAVQDAKRTRDGLPTEIALLQREWIERTDDPSKSSFAVACDWLSLDAAVQRARLLALIDAHWQKALQAWARALIERRRAAVLTCAGMRFAAVKRIAIGRQYVLPLVSEAEYETVAGVEHGDPKGWGERKRKKAA